MNLFLSLKMAQILSLHSMVYDYFTLVRAFGEDPNNEEKMAKLRNDSFAIIKNCRESRSSHWQSLSEKKMSPLLSTSFPDVLHSYRKVKDHLFNVAEAMHGDK